MNRSLLIFMFFILNIQCSMANDFVLKKQEYIKSSNIRDYTTTSGQQIADYLNEDYRNAIDNCDEATEPAFLCSGVMIRAALSGKGYHVWDPSPDSQQKGGVSFSYLRIDDNSTELVHNETSGFIFYPYFYAPDGKNTDIDVMCSFPLDADTTNRTNHGCGAHSGGYTKSSACQDQGITTASQWYNNGTSMDGQCGFITSDESQYNTADAFIQSIKSRALLTESQRATQNEIRLSAWAVGMQDTLPVEAFFYFSGSSAGLADARINQEDFYNSTTGHIVVPIIEIITPTSTSGSYQFQYNTSDQVVNLNKK